MSTMPTATLGFPRMGRKRELKVALEKYWGKEIGKEELLCVWKEVLRASVRDQAQAGVSQIGVGDQTLYDQVLDWSERFGLTARRVSEGGLTGLDAYFAQARGAEGVAALDMTKYFDTNYHYMVPEVVQDVRPHVTEALDEFLHAVKEGQAVLREEEEKKKKQQQQQQQHQHQAQTVSPILLGPVSLAKLCRTEGQLGWAQLAERLTECYCEVVRRIGKECGTKQGKEEEEEEGSAGRVTEVQLHEPWLVRSEAAGKEMQAVCEAAYERICAACKEEGLGVNLCVHFDSVDEAVYRYVTRLPVTTVTVDLCRGLRTLQVVESLGLPAGKRLGAGVVDARNVWRDGRAARAVLRRVVKAVGGADRVTVTPSCSLQFVPYDLELETKLGDGLKGKLAFAVQKLQVLVELSREDAVDDNTTTTTTTTTDGGMEDNLTECKMEGVVEGKATTEEELVNRSERDAQKRREQQVKVPLFPTTTIGSFPQTREVRRVRLGWKQGKVGEAEYREAVEKEMRRTIDVQKEIGLDVLVHGEAERSDMVEHFGEHLEGMAFTQHGWVQSYGSRCVRPPIMHGSIRRRGPMTVRDFEAAQRYAGEEVPVKGMLTGPVTLLNWSFCRTDVPRSVQAFELALAVREEVKDLERAGCRVVQVDEAALRERMPLKDEDGVKYMRWAVKAFRVATCGALPETQIVTHMCYSAFEDIVQHIDGMGADVLTIENSRSGNDMLEVLASYGYSRDIGPGVYDIHSPVVPAEDQLLAQVNRLQKSGLHPSKLWINPDCGLKTRKWEEVIPSLTNMVRAARAAREAVAAA